MTRTIEKSFSKSAIPKTVKLIDVLTMSAPGPYKWNSHDRVLALLDPEMVPKIEAFYAGRGPRLEEVLDTDSGTYDKECLKKVIDLIEVPSDGTCTAF